jgi:hypothetical protein
MSAPESGEGRAAMSGSNVKSQSTYGFTGVLNYRTQKSGSRLDGNSFVGEVTEQGRQLRKSFKGQGDGIKTLTDMPGGRQIARHNQTGLFNLSSFERVKEWEAPPPLDVPPLPNQVQPNHDQVQSNQVQNQIQPNRQEPVPLAQRLIGTLSTVEDLETEVTDWAGNRQEGRRLVGSERQRDIIFRDTTTKSVATAMAELRRLEEEVRALPPGEERELSLQRLDQAKRETMLLALRLELPGLEISREDELVGRLIELEEKLIAAGRNDKDLGSGAFTLDKLLKMLANFGATRDLSVGLPKDKALAVDCLAGVVDMILESVGPGRDGGELNSLLGLNSELDGALKQLRFGAIRDLLTDDLCRQKGAEPPNGLTDEEKEKIRDEAREIVQVDEEIVRCHRQLGRALRKAGLTDLSTNDLIGVRIDSNMIRGMRNKFGKDSEQIALIVAALNDIEQAALKSPAMQRLCQALNRQLESAPREELTDEQQLRMRAIRDELRYLGTLMTEGKRNGVDEATLRDLSQRMEGLEAEANEILAPRTRSNDTIQRLRQRIESLTPEAQPIERRIDEARTEIEVIDQEIEALEAELDKLDARDNELLGKEIEQLTRKSFDEQIDLLMQKARLQEGGDSSENDPDGGVDGPPPAELLIARRRKEIEDKLEALGEKRTQAVERLDRGSEELEEVLRWSSGGFTDDELEELGLSTGNDDIAKTARRLARQGLANTGEVTKLCRDINALLRRLNGGQGGQGLENTVDVLNTRSNELRARDLANQLLGSITGGIEVGVGTRDLNDRMKGVLTGDDGLEGRLRDMGHLFDGRARQYGRKEQELLELTRELKDFAGDHDTAVGLVRGFEGRKIDPHRPQGLTVSKALVEITDLYGQCSGDRTLLSEEDQQRFDELARQLKGFNPETLEVPLIQLGAHTPTMEDVGAWLLKPDLVDTAKAIVFLREIEPEHDRQIEQLVGQLDGIVALREESLGPEDARLVRDTIRAAILHTLVATGAKIDSFRPSDHAPLIKQTLESWGLPVDRLRPEIERALCESFGPDELNLWLETTTLSQPYIEALETRRTTQRSTFVEGRTNQGLDPETARTIYDSIDSLQPGTSVKITMGDRVEVNSQKITSKIVPWLGINVRMGGGISDGLEIVRSGDGYELIIRDGIDGKFGTELSVGLKGGVFDTLKDKFGVGVDAGVTFEGSHLGVTGVALRFSSTNLTAMKETLRNILTKGEMTPSDLSSVDNIMPVVETKTGVKVGGFGNVGVKGSNVPGKTLPYSPSGGVRGNVGTGGSWRTFTSENTNLTVVKKEVETQTEVGLKVNLYFSTGSQQKLTNPIPGGGGLDPNLYGMEWQGGFQWVTKTKSKETRGLDGLVTSSTDKQRQTTLPTFWDKQSVEQRRDRLIELGGPAFQRIIETKFSDDQRAEMDRMLAIASAGDVLSIGFALDERVRTEVNDLLQRAKEIRSTGGFFSKDGLDEARKLEEDAQKLIDDPNNYNPSKLQLIPTSEGTTTFGVDLMFAKWERYYEDKSEWVALEMKFEKFGVEVRNEMVQ